MNRRAGTAKASETSTKRSDENERRAAKCILTHFGFCELCIPIVGLSRAGLNDDFFARLRLFFLHHTHELLERGPRDDAIELGSVVVNYANVFDHQVYTFHTLSTLWSL